MFSTIKLFAALPLLCGALLISSAGLNAQTPVTSVQSASTLTVRVTGIRNANGKIHLGLYRDSQFVEGRQLEIDARTLTATTVFTNLSRGVYAVNLFHDENMNNKMDTNLFGMPVEGYGFSNNPAKRMGKPGFDETNFKLNQPEAAIEIKMIYW
ncbi:MAG: DUF2141 domain-containing protein [Terracidiphilus sp.]